MPGFYRGEYRPTGTDTFVGSATINISGTSNSSASLIPYVALGETATPMSVDFNVQSNGSIVGTANEGSESASCTGWASLKNGSDLTMTVHVVFSNRTVNFYVATTKS